MAATSNSGFYKKLGKAGAAIVVAASLGAVPIIKHWEGRSLVPYYDIARVLTYCDGETLDVVKNKKYTDAECDALTQKRALQFAEGVAAALEVPVSQKTFESFIVFSYNIGLQNFRNSTALRQTNLGNPVQGCEAMIRFSCITVPKGTGDTAAPGAQYKGANCVTQTFNKKFVRGLYLRRDAERKQCLAGIEKNGSI
jgi:lysozyme